MSRAKIKDERAELIAAGWLPDDSADLYSWWWPPEPYSGPSWTRAEALREVRLRSRAAKQRQHMCARFDAAEARRQRAVWPAQLVTRNRR